MVYLVLSVSLVTAVFGQYFIKKLTVAEPLGKAINIMFIFCAVLALAISFLFGRGWQFNNLIFVIGFINGLVAWLFWRAIKVSLAQTMLFLPLTGFVGILLIAIFLEEWRFLNPQSLSGLLTLAGALGLLGSIWFFCSNNTKDKKIQKIWLWCIIGQSVAGGFIYFLIKYVALQEVPKTTYLLSWYFGSLAGSFLPRIFERNWQMKIESGRLFIYYFLLSAATLSSVLTNYWALELAPAALVLPISQFLNVLGSALVGLFIFHERKSFSFLDWIGVAVGFISMVLLIGGMSLVR